MIALWIAVAVIVAGAGVWWLTHTARTTAEPYTHRTETDESFLRGDFQVPHTCLPHYPTGAGDRWYRDVQAQREALNNRQGDPQ